MYIACGLDDALLQLSETFLPFGPRILMASHCSPALLFSCAEADVVQLDVNAPALSTSLCNSDSISFAYARSIASWALAGL